MSASAPKDKKAGAANDPDHGLNGLGGAPRLKASSKDPLIDLEEMLHANVDLRMSEMRVSLQAWIRTTISQWVARAEAEDPHVLRRRRVIDALKLRGDRSAEILLFLVDCPDIQHNYDALVRHLELGEEVSENAKNIIRVHISHIRGRLKEHGVQYAIQNQAHRGYMVFSADARRVRLLWGEEPEGEEPNGSPLAPLLL